MSQKCMKTLLLSFSASKEKNFMLHYEVCKTGIFHYDFVNRTVFITPKHKNHLCSIIVDS